MMLSVDETASGYVLLVARILISAVFLISGVHKALWREKVAAEFQRDGIPAINFTLPATVILHIVASGCIIVGWHTREAALALAVFTTVASLKVHAYWRLPEIEQLARSRVFFANVAIIGGLLLLCVVGPGDISISN